MERRTIYKYLTRIYDNGNFCGEFVDWRLSRKREVANCTEDRQYYVWLSEKWFCEFPSFKKLRHFGREYPMYSIGGDDHPLDLKMIVAHFKKFVISHETFPPPANNLKTNNV